jgi:hypothetical protein
MCCSSPGSRRSLAGRMDILTLWPLAQAEVEDGDAGLIDRLSNPDFSLTALPPLTRTDLVARIVAGGYPEPLARTSEAGGEPGLGPMSPRSCSVTCAISPASPA